MATAIAIRTRLTRVSRTIRAILRCLGGNKEPQDNSPRSCLLLCETFDLLSRLQEQLTWAEEKWVLEPTRLHNLNEVLRSFESTTETMEIYLQPGGVSARSFRRRLIDNTFISRLEHFKVMMILALQPDTM